MDYFAGLDVSVKDTSVCIVDGTGKIAREVKVASEPAALLAFDPKRTWAGEVGSGRAILVDGQVTTRSTGGGRHRRSAAHARNHFVH